MRECLCGMVTRDYSGVGVIQGSASALRVWAASPSPACAGDAEKSSATPELYITGDLAVAKSPDYCSARWERRSGRW